MSTRNEVWIGTLLALALMTGCNRSSELEIDRSSTPSLAGEWSCGRTGAVDDQTTFSADGSTSTTLPDGSLMSGIYKLDGRTFELAWNRVQIPVSEELKQQYIEVFARDGKSEEAARLMQTGIVDTEVDRRLLATVLKLDETRFEYQVTRDMKNGRDADDQMWVGRQFECVRRAIRENSPAEMAAAEPAVRASVATEPPNTTAPASGSLPDDSAESPPFIAGIEGQETQKKQVSYMIGQDMGKSLLVIKDELDLNLLTQGIADQFAGTPLKLTEEQALKVQEAFTAKVQARASGNADALAGDAGTGAPALIAGIEGLETERKQLSYMVGLDMGKSLKVIKDRLDLEVLRQALADRFAGKPSNLTEEQARKVQESFAATLQAKQTAEAEASTAAGKEAGAVFLATNKDKAGVQTTATGLQYEVVREGDGPSPGETDTVKVHYRGTLLDGTVFDSSYDRGDPAVFGLTQVIPGWSEGVQLMPVGSKFRLWIPANLAYGVKGGGPIPPNSTLVFDLELLEIVESAPVAPR